MANKPLGVDEDMLQTLSHENDTVDPVDVVSCGIDKLREEHNVLKDELADLCNLAKTVGQDESISNWSNSIEQLRSRIIRFMNQLDVHSLWEDQVLYPMVAGYTGRDMGPLAMLEYEHDLAKEHVRKFIEVTDLAGTLVNSQDAKEAASYLLQAYIVLNDHFRKEEEQLFPIAEQMLTDYEQFFS